MNFFKNLKKFQLISDSGKIYGKDEIKELSNTLQKLSKGKKLVLFMGDNDEYSILFYIACLNLRNCIMPISNNTSKKSLSKIIKNFNPEIIFAKENIINKNYKKLHTFGIYKIFKRKNIISKINKELALLLSTSGSTGESKYVKLTYKNIYSNASSIKKYLNLDTSHSTITTLPIHYSYGISVINSHLLADAKIYINKLSFFEKDFWHNLAKKKITNFSGVPFHFEILHRLNIEKLNLNSLKFCTQAGGKLNVEIIKSFVEKFSKLKKKFYVMYGQTEASPRISYADEKDLMKYPETVGKPIPGGKIIIKNSKKNFGEICYKGKNVFNGYAKNRNELKKLEKINTLRTGDIGQKKQNLLFITGRLSRFQKIYGVRVNLDILERYLNNLKIKCFCIFKSNKIFIFTTKLVENENNIKFLIKNDFEININTIEFIKINRFPYNLNNKIDYKILNEKIK
jgi:long-chain acyl-CoA synthetase